MTQDQVQWVNDAIEICERASQKKVLVLIRKDGTETSEDEQPHHVIVTNATAASQIMWLVRGVNGEVEGDDDDEGADG